MITISVTLSADGDIMVPLSELRKLSLAYGVELTINTSPVGSEIGIDSFWMNFAKNANNELKLDCSRRRIGFVKIDVL